MPPVLLQPTRASRLLNRAGIVPNDYWDRVTCVLLIENSGEQWVGNFSSCLLYALIRCGTNWIRARPMSWNVATVFTKDGRAGVSAQGYGTDMYRSVGRNVFRLYNVARHVLIVQMSC